MQFFGEAVNVLQTLVIALGAGLCVWGGINLMEGYGNDNPGAKMCIRDRSHALLVMEIWKTPKSLRTFPQPYCCYIA